MSGVRVAYIDLDQNGVPDAPSKNKERNERARISDELATKLGLTIDDDDRFPQIRVLTDVALSTAGTGTGIFSVFEIYDDTVDSLEVYADEAAGDEDSGQFRLYEEQAVDFAQDLVTVVAEAPSSTTIVDEHGFSVETLHFCEPHDDSTLVEETRVRDDKRFVLLVPHGGEIELATSEQIAPIESALAATWGVDANTWDVRGHWHQDDFESEHWHITSSEVTSAGFPGLEALESDTDFAVGRPFQYAASLHGMSFSKEGLVLGGRAHREAKCLVASRVRERMEAEGLPIPAVYIWNYDKDFALSVEVPHGDGDLISVERDPNPKPGDPHDPGLSGTSSDNIVNVLSPNASGDAGFGGMQIEQSPSLRDGTILAGLGVSYRDLVAQEIAHAFGELITRPGIIDPSSTLICDALVAGEPPALAEIGGRAFWDDDASDTESAGDRGAAGLRLGLYEGGSLLEQTVTAADGSYRFDRLAPGDYLVQVDDPMAVFAPVARNVGGDDTVDNDFDAAGTSDLLTLAAGQASIDVDLGIELVAGTASLGDFAWHDLNEDGAQDPGEPGLADVLLELRTSEGVLVASTTTDAAGAYAFTGLPAGDYELRATASGAFYPTLRHAAGSAVDSDIDAAGLAQVTVASGIADTTLDAGFALGCDDATLVPFGSVWSWSNGSEDGWNTPGFFEDPVWDRDLASFGYNRTVVTTIPDVGPVSYFRLPFTLEDASIVDALDLTLVVEEGAIVYLNGTEIFRSNVPVTSGGTSTVAAQVASPPLVDGPNLLAVEVHRKANDDDLRFDLEVSTTICRPCLHSITVPASRGTFLDAGDTSDVMGGEPALEVDGSTQKNALIGWDLSALPSDAEVLHTGLAVFVEDTSSERFDLYPMRRAWVESEATWELPAAGSDWTVDGALGKKSANASSFDYDDTTKLGSMRFTSSMGGGSDTYPGLVLLNVDGRALAQRWIRGELANDGLFLPGERGTNGLDLTADGREGGPVLELVYRSCSP